LTRDITYSAFFLALGLLLPQILPHTVAGGAALSPMHIPVLLSAFFLGLPFAAAVGLLSPLLSFLLFGMPPVPMFFIMMLELGAYAAVCRLMYAFVTVKVFKLRSRTAAMYLSLTAALILGRVAGTIGAVSAFWLMGFSGYTGFFAYLWGLFAGGAAAMVIQLLLIPPLVTMVKARTGEQTTI
jgi:uncharacterized membrane protein